MEFFLSIIEMFTSPIYQTAMIGSILACVSLSLIGVIYYLRKSALVGEVIAHSCFPGLIVGGFIAIVLSLSKQSRSFVYLAFACISSYISMRKLKALQNRCKKSADSSMMLSISAFLAIGILLVSIMQSVNPVIYQELIVFLYGRAATMLQIHLVIYAVILVGLISFIWSFFEKIKIAEFDRSFGGFFFSLKRFDGAILALTLLIIIFSLRTCGVLLIAGLMTTPAIAAKCWAKKTSSIFVLSAVFGVFSAMIGNYLSLYLGSQNFSLATGPIITVVSSLIALVSLFFGKEQGICKRVYKRLVFSIRCQKEHLLKICVKKDRPLPIRKLRKLLGAKNITFFISLFLVRKYLTYSAGKISLNEQGMSAAKRVIRLHRLWEVYLYEVGFTKDRVHVFAEEIEHVITKEMEERLVQRLNNPTHCPHQQKIPEKTARGLYV